MSPVATRDQIANELSELFSDAAKIGRDLAAIVEKQKEIEANRLALIAKLESWPADIQTHVLANLGETKQIKATKSPKREFWRNSTFAQAVVDIAAPNKAELAKKLMELKPTAEATAVGKLITEFTTVDKGKIILNSSGVAVLRKPLDKTNTAA